MTFEEWWEANINTASPLCRYDKAAAAWDYQQASIDGLLEDRKMDRSRINDLEDRAIESRTRIDELERWVAGIADDQQIPDWIQQSARSLLAQEGECEDNT